MLLHISWTTALGKRNSIISVIELSSFDIFSRCYTRARVHFIVMSEATMTRRKKKLLHEYYVLMILFGNKQMMLDLTRYKRKKSFSLEMTGCR